MKLLIVTCIYECRKEVFKMFKQANIEVFSVTDLTGIKTDSEHNILDDWFASGEEKFDSLMLFSFADAIRAEACLSLIKTYNQNTKPDFPVRAFIVPVEKTA